MGLPADAAAAHKLASEWPFRFETWAVERLPGFHRNDRQVGDGGIDGTGRLFYEPEDYSRDAVRASQGRPVQVDRVARLPPCHRDRERAAVGCYVTLEPVTSRAARQAAAGAGTGHSGGDSPIPGCTCGRSWTISGGQLPPLR